MSELPLLVGGLQSVAALRAGRSLLCWEGVALGWGRPPRADPSVVVVWGPHGVLCFGGSCLVIPTILATNVV